MCAGVVAGSGAGAEQEQEKGARVFYQKDGRGRHLDLHLVFHTGLLLGWVDSELFTEQDSGRSNRRRM